MTRHYSLLALFLFACSSGGGYVPTRIDGGIENKLGDAGAGHDLGTMKSGTCSDGIKNDDESDVDCGGSCSPCAAEHHCNSSTDCQSMNCQTGTCAPGANCSDGIQNGGESDVDCGGPCGPCADSRHCVVNNDCQSAQCTDGTCAAAPSCFDGIKNGQETDVDCGGNCAPCADGLACKIANDCSDGSCSNLLCCGSGFGNCNGISGDGCEVTFASDAKNCGSCGHACPQNTPVCSNSVCVAQSQCDVSTEVSYNGHCYYLDGNGGKCDGGYVLASQTVLATIAAQFSGRNYKHTISDNCCIYNADGTENYGMADHCNVAGPFDGASVALGADSCNGVANLNPNQLTLCYR